MNMSRKIVIIFGALLALTGCLSNLQPSFSERDKYVINTPEYPDNRVFYVKKFNGTNESSISSSLLLHECFKASKKSSNCSDISFISNRQPLSIIANAVSIPYKEGAPSKDIAVLLEIKTDTQKDTEPIVVWYQRGVLPGQTLNFANLLLYSQDSYDGRVAPFFRIRVVDVATERNLETRETLSQVSRYGGSVAAASGNPLLGPILSVASKAASLVLANQQNKMLLDYTVQFYPKDIIYSSNNPNLTPFLKGRFVLVGRSKDELKNKDYWKDISKLDELNSEIVRTGTTIKSDFSPIVSLEVIDEEMSVLPIVALKTAYLTKLLNDTTTSNLNEISQLKEDLIYRLDVYTTKESIQRYQIKTDIADLINLAQNESIPSDLKDYITRYLSRISGCYSLTANNLSEWWNQNKSNLDFRSIDDLKTATENKILLKPTGASGEICTITSTS